MQIKRSELKIENLLILASNIVIVPTSPVDKFISFDNIDLDADFNILTNAKDKSNFKVIITISGNISESKKPGYSFSVASEGIFQIVGVENMEKELIDGLLVHSALPILFSHVRSYLMNTTSYYPFGKYVLPAIDLNALLSDKTQNLQSKK
jgi:preprotein translocase subunit SecB